MAQNDSEKLRVLATPEMFEEIKTIKVNTEKSISTITKIIFRRIEYNYRDVLDKEKQTIKNGKL